MSARHIIYVAYWGLLEPLGQSLILPAVRALARRGIRVSLLTFDKSSDLADRSAVESLQASLQAEGVSWRPLRYHKRPTAPATLFDVLAGTVAACRISWRSKPDIVHARTFVGGLIGAVASRLLRVPWLYHSEGFWPDQQVEGGFWPPGSLVYRITHAIDEWMLRKADGLIILAQRSQATAEALRGGD